jgi:hypothetical protein
VARKGKAWLGKARLVVASQGKACLARQDVAREGKVRLGKARRG